MADLTQNIIAFQRGMFLLDGNEDHRDLACTIQAELMHFGYMLTGKAFERLSHASESDAISFHDEITAWIRETIGDGNYRPLYEGFPTQVMNMTDAELFLNAFLHYLSDGTYIPEQCPTTAQPAFEHTKYRMIDVTPIEDFNRIFTDLVSVNQSISPADCRVLEWFIGHRTRQELQALMPATVPFKETLCWLAVKLDLYPEKLTTTDALRIIVGRSGGDYLFTSEADPIRNFCRAERREIMAMLESLPINVEEMKRYEKRWIRVGERLHVGDYAKVFPKTFQAFQTLRNEKIRTWNSLVENAESLEAQLELLAQRPGEFARRLDALLRVGTPEELFYMTKCNAIRIIKRTCSPKKKKKKNTSPLSSIQNVEKPVYRMTPEERWKAFSAKLNKRQKRQFLKIFQEEFQQNIREMCDMWAARAMNRAGRKALESLDPENED
ncbi:MAG: hypothetical protein K6C40_03565 [Thermoguttaceae bacterium]|nr:hypothetical protein [Thermoguttaceae bacterium]